MSTSMHRLQISLPRSQVRYLFNRARSEGISIAEVIRRLIRKECCLESPRGGIDSLREIIGIARDTERLTNNTPVSEQPDLYIFEENASYSKAAAKKRASGIRKKA